MELDFRLDLLTLRGQLRSDLLKLLKSCSVGGQIELGPEGEVVEVGWLAEEFEFDKGPHSGKEVVGLGGRGLGQGSGLGGWLG